MHEILHVLAILAQSLQMNEGHDLIDNNMYKIKTYNFPMAVKFSTLFSTQISKSADIK